MLPNGLPPTQTVVTSGPPTASRLILIVSAPWFVERYIVEGRHRNAGDNERSLSMTHIAFIGLGVMGLPMARNLVAAGHDVTGFNRSPARTRLLAEAGGHVATSIAETVAGADIVVTMLPDSPDVEAVLLGDDAGLAHAAAGSLIIDMSTVAPATSIRIADEARQRGLRALDAPVSGGEVGAIDGSLSIMIGGESADVETARPVFEALGTTIVHVGPAGAGQTVKAANQLIVAGHLQLLAEALVFLGAHGVDLPSAVDVLGGGLAGSAVLSRKSANMLTHEFTPGFRVDLHHKDLGIVTSAARTAGVSLPLGSHVADLVAALRAQGYGSLDHSALLIQAERASGRETSPHGR
ncbi:MAG TPA: 2-hydroxy-3-oxopropionate reductase [Pseudolysinimonas sp.]|nr:2-hydroxy-3-oxopropionate reductase [Pseudolysinimonas sp.]